MQSSPDSGTMTLGSDGCFVLSDMGVLMKETIVKRSSNTALVVFTVLAMAFSASGEPAQADDPMDILVIGNNSLGVGQITPSDLSDIYLGRKTAVGGAKVVPLHAKGALREAFAQRALQMSADEEANFWEEQKIRSGATAPTAFGNPLKAVFSIKGAIGYCYRKDYREGVVKVLLSL